MINTLYRERNNFMSNCPIVIVCYFRCKEWIARLYCSCSMVVTCDRSYFSLNKKNEQFHKKPSNCNSWPCQSSDPQIPPYYALNVML